MPDASDKLTPADPRDVDELMLEMVAKRLVGHLKRAHFVILKRPPIEARCSVGGSRAD